ncbi:MAG: biotin transporter BioY [Coriobacteriales bacterium]|jgi:biotin transport system substrate-specific component|nr:biotin transporter BioY [Coriobacteriales bacterium]
MRSNSKTRSIALCGLSIALLTVGAFVTVPFGPVPFTLQTMMLLLIVLLLRPSEAVAAVGGYLALGAIGLPVFAGMRGGIAVLAGPTGGFLVGFLVAAAVVGLLRFLFERRSKPSRSAVVRLVQDIAASAAASAVFYACGTLWFSFVTGNSIAVALAACVIPFLLPDAIKAIAAILTAQPVRAALGIRVTAESSKNTQ